MIEIQRAQRLIEEADALIITAGAGMGVDSGLPDFRGVEGFWRAYPVIKDLGLRFEEMANPKWFQEEPSLAWAFYGHRLNLYRQTIPHKGFKSLLELAEKKEHYFIFTSNVDGQFQKAGFDPKCIVEVHGSIHHLQCLNNCNGTIWEADIPPIMIDEHTFRAKTPLPHCPHCNALARPNILMFGDYAWLSYRTDIQSNRLQHFLDTIMIEKKKTVILEFGAGESIPTVRVFGEQIAQAPHITLIRINPRDFNVPQGNISLAMGAKEAIEKLLK
jgi:NAD-dependent SIR2 family protein deacetylase